MTVCTFDGTLLSVAAASTRKRADKLIGSYVLDRYRIETVLKHSPQTSVFAGIDQVKSSRVAIKILNLENRLHPDKQRRAERFLRQVANSKRLSHPNIVPLLDQGVTADGAQCLVFELVDNALQLSQFRGRLLALPPSTFIEIFKQICDALEYAHYAGVFHEDLAPENVLLSSGLHDAIQVKLIDFAKGTALLHGENINQQRTEHGDLFGSAEFMSPETALGLNVDCSANIYSMGCMMYSTLSMQLPHDGAHWAAIVLRRLEHPASPLLLKNKDESSRAVEEIVAKCLNSNPSSRYESMAELRTALQAVRLAADTPAQDRVPSFSRLKTLAGPLAIFVV